MKKIILPLAACLAIAGCSLLTPGYDETKAELHALAVEAKAQREADQAAASAAVKGHDPLAIADALDKLQRSMAAEMDARLAQMKHEVDSAAKAGGGLMELLGPSLGAIGIILGGIAQARATKTESRAAATETRVAMNEVKPSRAQPEIDDQRDRLMALEKQMAVMLGKADPAPQVKVVNVPVPAAPAPHPA